MTEKILKLLDSNKNIQKLLKTIKPYREQDINI